MKITIGIPTRDRPLALARLLASLHAQTYREWDLVIVDDSVGRMLDAPGELMLEAIRTAGHQVQIVPGVRINQAYSHNHVLWSPDTHDWILRVDDDLILAPDYLEKLVEAVRLRATVGGEPVAAVSGVIFTEHLWPRDEHPPISPEDRDSVAVGARGEHLSPFPFMQEYTRCALIPTEHLYSSCLYNKQAMQQVGGWPLVYSRGVSYHEETDGTHRLFLSGQKLYLFTAAYAWHTHENAGGTRLMSPAEHRQRREADWEQFTLRLGQIRGIEDFRPSVALCSQHCGRIGGGERLTYSLLATLQGLVEQGWLSRADLYPLNDEPLMSAAEVRDYFGVSVDLEQEAPPEYYDIAISLGHAVPDDADLPLRKHHIHYSLYPLQADAQLHRVDRYVAISDFSADGVARTHRRNAETVYPFVNQYPAEALDKRRIILLIGRLDWTKGISVMAEAFLKMDLPEAVELHIVTTDDGGDDNTEAERVRLLAQHPRIVWRYSLSQPELRHLMREAALLWAGRGYGCPANRPDLGYEHFGYTVVEALSHYCLPLAYDAGGYQETAQVRWGTLEELEALTRQLLDSIEEWEAALRLSLEVMHRFTPERFVANWKRILLSTHGLAWRPEIEWREPGPADIRVMNTDTHIAVLSDHPGRGSGYGIVCQEVTKGLQEAGYKVHMLAYGAPDPDLDARFASLWPVPKDTPLSRVMTPFLNHHRFDAAVVMYDPFVGKGMVKAVHSANQRTPIISFISQEGTPAHNAWGEILRLSRTCITYSQAAATAIEERFDRQVDWVHLGVNHAPFEIYDPDTRRALRRILGWEDKFVIFYVGRNVRNKNIPALMRTVALLKQWGYDDLKLVLHTNPRPDERFHGIDIQSYAETLGLFDPASGRSEVALSQAPRAAPFAPYAADLDAAFAPPPPYGESAQREWFNSLGLIARYNIADLYLDLASVEGFGLPLFEAMACGVPAITLDDQFVRREVIGPHTSLVFANPLDTWTTGAQMALVDPVNAAAMVQHYRQGWGGSAIEGQAAADIVSGLRWEKVRNKVVEAVKCQLSMA